MAGASGRSWQFRLVLILAVLAFVGFSIAPALAPLKNLSTAQAPGNGQTSVDLLQREVAGYRIVLEREPDNILALRSLTEDLLRLGQVDEAIAPLQHWVELEPENVELALQLGQFQVQAGQFEAAIETFNPLYERQPNRSDILENLVDAEVAAGDVTAAIALLETRLQDKQSAISTAGSASTAAIPPQAINTALLLARTYLQSDRVDDSLALYDRLIAEHPSNYRAPFEKAIALSTLASDRAQPDSAGLLDASYLFDRAANKAPDSTAKSIRAISKRYANLLPEDTQSKADEPSEAISPVDE